MWAMIRTSPAATTIRPMMPPSPGVGARPSTASAQTLSSSASARSTRLLVGRARTPAASSRAVAAWPVNMCRCAMARTTRGPSGASSSTSRARSGSASWSNAWAFIDATTSCANRLCHPGCVASAKSTISRARIGLRSSSACRARSRAVTGQGSSEASTSGHSLSGSWPSKRSTRISASARACSSRSARVHVAGISPPTRSKRRS